MKTIIFAGITCILDYKEYQNGGTRLQLIEQETGEPVATCTVCIPGEPLEENEVFVKDYSENAGMLQCLVSNDIVSHPIGWCQQGYVDIPKCILLYPKPSKYIPS